jgi:hypothetical protein
MSSCNNTPSYADLKKAQEKAIGRFVAEKGFEILSTYPSDGVFGENQFVKLDNGIYLNVVDSGNGNRAVVGKTVVLTRFKVINFSDDAQTTADFFDNWMEPFEFLYGNAAYVVSSSAQSYDYYYTYFSAGIESILGYVGENAVVKAIIPFEEGSTSQSTLGTPLYYEKLKFMYYLTPSEVNP